jgi:threonine dehydrogenase-like Zn-dependent dehydrogenase
MRAVVYDEPFKVTVRSVQKPTILHPDDIIVKGTRTFLNIFGEAKSDSQMGSHYYLHLWQVNLLVISLRPLRSHAARTSDLHMYEGRTAAESGIVFGHEK